MASTDAWQILQSTTLVLGFHPDEATDACVDFCLQRKLPFCICPCCVFASVFSHRRRTVVARDGTTTTTTVSSYEDYLKYLQAKHPKMRLARLPFASAATGHGRGLVRNTVLYMLPSDYL